MHMSKDELTKQIQRCFLKASPSFVARVRDLSTCSLVLHLASFYNVAFIHIVLIPLCFSLMRLLSFQVLSDILFSLCMVLILFPGGGGIDSSGQANRKGQGPELGRWLHW